MKLGTKVTTLPQISDKYAAKLEKLGIRTVRELLTHFPRYHKDTTEITSVGDIEREGKYTIQVGCDGVKSIRLRGGRRTMQTSVLSDETGNIKAMWFNQPYLTKAINDETEYLISGKAKEYRGGMTFFPDNFEPIIEGREQVHLGRISPQYPLTSGISIKWLRNRIKYVTDRLGEIEDLQDETSPGDPSTLISSLRGIHFPKDEEDIEEAREYLQMLELINLQIKIIKNREGKAKIPSPVIENNLKVVGKFLSKLEFELTADQQTVVEEILEDLSERTTMNRLLQGDVGTGKTIVAVVAALNTTSSGYQTIVLAPTTVLAEQHYKTFESFLKEEDVRIELVTGTTSQQEPADILIGTSAVLARKQNLIDNLGLVIVDEQHRFGVGQREELLEPLNLKGSSQPHMLDMTATPIPRTLALALFSDLKVSSITTKPAGRKPIKTFVVPENKREDGYEWIRKKVTDTNEQVYWICPLVEESEKLEVKSAKEIYKRLSEEVFQDLRVGLLHGKLKPRDKQEIMDSFNDHKLDILVSTSVIEVGVDVPNATVMVVEGAERFGLAQLHQIRGRVGRSDKQSWNFLFPSEEITPQAEERLNFFASNTDGLKIAEYDLQNRGPGEVYGTRQSGIPDLKIATLDDMKKIRDSKDLAQKLYVLRVKNISLFL